MRLKDLAVVGLATTVSGRRLQLRQNSQYDANSTVTAVVVSTSTATLPTSSSSSSSSQSETTQTTPALVAPVPYSSPESSPSSSSSTTSTTSTTATTYSSQRYSFAPSGTTPSGYTSSSSVTAPPTYGPTGTGTAPAPSSYPNATCSGATLNVLEASLDWWYTRTLYYAVSTISVQYNGNDTSTGWTVLPATTSFDVESALAVPECTTTRTWVNSRNASLYDVDCTSAASPVAAETTIITQTAYLDPPSTTGNGSLPQLVITPEPASISVADATQAPYAEGTPFVFFSAYEIVTKSSTVFQNGSAGCAEATQTYTMDDAFSFEYTGPDVNGSLLVGAGVTGDVNPALLGLVGQDTAVAGSWVAEPTVVLLMQEVLVAQAELAATIQPTASFLETPTATRPTFVTLTPTGQDNPPQTFESPRVESSQTQLQVPTGAGGDNRPTAVGPEEQTQGGNGGGNPGGQATQDEGGRPFTSFVAFIANVAQSDVTLMLPAAPTQAVVTAEFQGQVVTATAASLVQGGSGGQGQQGGGVGGLIGAVNSAARPTPTNAFDVLSQAEATFGGSNPTANAIINGIGGGSAQEDNLPGQNGGSGSGSGASGSDADGSRVITVGGAVITPNAQNEYTLPSGQTLTPGGNVIVDGTTYSLAPDASAIVVNGVTQNLVSPAQATGGPDIPLIAVGSAAITPNAATEYSIAPGATLTPGGSVVVDGTTYSLDTSGGLVVNGVTRGTDAGANGAGDITMAPILTINGETFRAINGGSGTTYVIDGETLTMGEEETVTIDGTVYQVSLSPSATRLIIETENANGQVTASSTQTLFPEQGSGSGSGPSETGSQSAGPEQQVGNMASTSTVLPWSGIYFGFGSLFLAIWL